MSHCRYCAQIHNLDAGYPLREAAFDTPFVCFHRTLGDYYATFQAAGLRVTDVVEPSVTERGERELAPYYVRHLKRIPYSVALRLERE